MMKQKFICLIIFVCVFLLCTGTGYSYEAVVGVNSCKGCHNDIQYYTDWHDLHTLTGLLSCGGCHVSATEGVVTSSCAACHNPLPCNGEGGHEFISERCLSCHVNCETEKDSACLAEAVLEKQNPNLVTLRTYRDEILSSNMAGRAMIKIYYVIGGPIANVCKSSPTIKKYVRQMMNMVLPAIEDSLPDE